MPRQPSGNIARLHNIDFFEHPKKRVKTQTEGQQELPANSIVPRNHHVRSVDQEPIPFPGNVIDDDLDNEPFPELEDDSWFNDGPPPE